MSELKHDSLDPYERLFFNIKNNAKESYRETMLHDLEIMEHERFKADRLQARVKELERKLNNWAYRLQNVVGDLEPDSLEIGKIQEEIEAAAEALKSTQQTEKE